MPEIPVLVRLATSLTGQPAEAEESGAGHADACLPGRGRFDRRHPRASLLTILRSTHAKQGRRRPPVLLRAELPETAPLAFGAPPCTPEELLVNATFDAAVEQALRQLRLRFGHVVELVDVEGLS